MRMAPENTRNGEAYHVAHGLFMHCHGKFFGLLDRGTAPDVRFFRTAPDRQAEYVQKLEVVFKTIDVLRPATKPDSSAGIPEHPVTGGVHSVPVEVRVSRKGGVRFHGSLPSISSVRHV